MKRLTAMLLLLSMLLCGCADRLKEPVTFYYIREAYETDMSDLIGSELREASGHRDDLSYLMALYLMGPADEELRSPLPAGTRIHFAELQNNTVILQLSDLPESMTDVQFTLACGCLTLTCLEITDAESVTIMSGDRSVTLDKDTLLLQDLTTKNHTEDNK